MNTPTRVARAAAMHRHLDDRLEHIEHCAKRLVGWGVGVRDGDAVDWREHHWMTDPLEQSYFAGVVWAIWFAHAATGGDGERYVPPTHETIEQAQVEHALNIRCVRQYLVRERQWRHTEVDRALDDLVHDEAIRLVAEHDGDVRIDLLKRGDAG
jgi:hypothetical protein